MINKFTADDARAIVKTTTPKAIEPLMLCAERRIRVACVMGKTSTTHPFHEICPTPSRELEEAALKELENRGFKVTRHKGDYSDPREVDYVEVSW